MSKEIAINTTTLQSDIDKLNQALEQVRKSIDEAYTATFELDKMWDGPANIAFQTAFRKDQNDMEEICKVVESMIRSMSLSKTEYEKCEADVNTIIESIKI
ncbi:MAG: hypothetical protein IJ600_12995 [Lachnospiraceae bacterium]|nr:hypothetical protein [Lachnospiraceae bacterium]